MQENYISVSIIIVNYNGKQFLPKLIESIKAQIFNDKLEIIIVDNHSSDDSSEFIKNNYSEIILIENTSNRGHSEACNQGAKVAKGNYLYFVDNDSYLEKNCIHELLETFNKKKDCGIVGGMVKDYGSNYIQEIGVNIDIFGYSISNIGSPLGIFVEDKNQFNEIFETFSVSSCGLLIPKDLFLKVGGFDQKYFMYKDDLDLCWRIQLIGYKIYVNPRAKIYHKMGVTLGGTVLSLNEKEVLYLTTIKKRYFGEKNTIRTLLKNYKLNTLFFILPLYLLINIGEIILLSLKNPKVSKVYLKAWFWNIKEFKNTLSLKKEIQSMRKITDTQILKKMHSGIGKLIAYRKLKIDFQ